MSTEKPFEISEFEIRGFKCIPYWGNSTFIEIPKDKETTVKKAASYLYKFSDLGNFIVVTGNNAAGKSTLLQALFLALGSGLKKLDLHGLPVNNKQIVLDLTHKYMGLSSNEELNYLFHRVKKPREMIDYASNRIMIRLKLSSEDTEASIELFFERTNGNISIRLEDSSLDEFSPRIDDIYVFQPIYPVDTLNHLGLFSAKGLGELDIPIENRIGKEEGFNSFVINFIYRLTQIIGEDKKLPFLHVPIQFIPLGAYVSSRLELVWAIQEIKRKIYNIGAGSDIGSIFIFEEPEIGLHPILQKKFVRKIYREFFDENGRRAHKEGNIVIIVTQSDHILNEAIMLAYEKKDNKNFKPTFIDCCQKIVRIKDVSSGSTISCIYQKYYPDYESPGTISPYRNDLDRTNSKDQDNICGPHSFLEALLYEER